jgi:hypothetical protein
MSAYVAAFPSHFGFHPDSMTLGPVLPSGWDGDSWVRPCPLRGESFLLRARERATGRVVIGRGLLYADSCRHLLNQLRQPMPR